jgi:hypothetical protein
MDKRVAIWNVLHDGEITALAREADTLTMFVSIPYLRRRISPIGDSVVLRLEQVTQVAFASFDGEPESLDEVLDLGRLDILGTDSTDMPLAIDTSMGRLTLAFAGFELALDTGGRLDFDTLDRAAVEYWNEWEKKGAAKNAGNSA